MATDHCNFAERTLDAWVKDTLDHYAATPQDIPADGDTWLRDRGGKNSVPGLCLRLRLRREDGAFTLDGPRIGFYLVRKFNGKKRSLLIGDRAVYTIEMARDKALEEQRDLEQGIDRRAERKRADAEAKGTSITYREALTQFLAQADVSDGTKAKYRLSLSTTFKTQADRPLVDFTDTLVRDLHRERSKASPSRADQDFRVLRLLWNWARDQYKDPEGNPVLGDNPVSVALNKRRAAGATKARWNDVPRRETVIPEERLGDWFAALSELRADPASHGVRVRSCDLLEALALTGLRFNELATLTWDLVDFTQGTLTVPAPRSKNRRPLLRPLTRRVRAILETRSQERAVFDTDLVFPGRRPGQPIKDPRTLHKAIASKTGLTLVSHDLRRVFASAALRAGVPQLVLKRLLNHLSNGADVTAGYQISSLGDLRDAAQRTEDHLLGKAGLLPDRDAESQIKDLLGNLPAERRAAILAAMAGQGGMDHA